VAEYRRRREHDRALIRRNLPVTIPIVVVIPFVVYVAVHLGVDLLNGWVHHGLTTSKGPRVAGPKKVVNRSEANWLSILLAVMALIGLAGAFWGRRQSTEAWRRGAEGEEYLARQLDRLGRHGYQVLHDRRVPGSKANIDHLVVGPTGVFVVDAKDYGGRLTWSKGTLWHGRYPMTKKLVTARWEAEQVRAALGHGVMVVNGSKRLLAQIRHRPVVLTRSQIADFFSQASDALVPA